MFTILTLNDAAFARLLAYTGHDGDRLIQAIPSLAPAVFTVPLGGLANRRRPPGLV
jgi:hypothetical protein